MSRLLYIHWNVQQKIGIGMTIYFDQSARGFGTVGSPLAHPINLCGYGLGYRLAANHA